MLREWCGKICGLSATRPLELTSWPLKGKGKSKDKGDSKHRISKMQGKSAREGQSETERRTTVVEGEEEEEQEEEEEAKRAE
jgi:hypothetical protein